jgi:hypothetical protein
MSTRNERLAEFMEELGFEKFESPGVEAFRKDGRVIEFFWWANAKLAAEKGWPPASLVIRDIHSMLHIDTTRPWDDVKGYIRAFIERQ